MKRFEVWLTDFDSTKGAEVQKTRTAVILSPDGLNRTLMTLIVAPLTSSTKRYPMRTPTQFGSCDGQVMLDQLRSVDKTRLRKKLGVLDKDEATATCQLLNAMFKY